MRSLPKKYAPKSYDQMKKEHDLSDLSPKQIQKVLMKIDEMQDVFLKSAEHEKKHLFDFSIILGNKIAITIYC